MAKIGNIFNVLEESSMQLAGICLAAIMLIVSCDAAFRYLFNSPLSWSFSVITLYLITAATFLAFASAFKAGVNINIDFATQFMSARARRVCAAISNLLILPVLCIAIYASAADALEAYQQTRFSPGVIAWREWPGSALIAFGLSLLLLRVAYDFVRQLLDAYQDSPAEEVHPQEDIL